MHVLCHLSKAGRKGSLLGRGRGPRHWLCSWGVHLGPSGSEGQAWVPPGFQWATGTSLSGSGMPLLCVEFCTFSLYHGEHILQIRIKIRERAYEETEIKGWREGLNTAWKGKEKRQQWQQGEGGIQACDRPSGSHLLSLRIKGHAFLAPELFLKPIHTLPSSPHCSLRNPDLQIQICLETLHRGRDLEAESCGQGSLHDYMVSVILFLNLFRVRLKEGRISLEPTSFQRFLHGQKPLGLLLPAAVGVAAPTLC